MPKFTNENSHTPLISTENLTPYGLNNETIRYYRSIDIVGESDICDMSEAHIVNCAGIDTFNEPFRTVRPFGRKDEKKHCLLSKKLIRRHKQKNLLG